MRIILSTMLVVFIISAGLLSRFNLANGHRITQALFGAGIGVLFASTFAASGLYQLISDTVALLGFCAITALSVCLSYFYGLPVALLGLAGGYLTPAFISAKQMHPSVFFLYLYGVSAAAWCFSVALKSASITGSYYRNNGMDDHTSSSICIINQHRLHNVDVDCSGCNDSTGD